MHGRAAEQAVALAGRRLDGVEGDRTHHGQRHRGGRVAGSLRSPCARSASASGAAPRCSSSSRTRRCPSPARTSTSSACRGPAINFADTHARDNTYLAPYELPLTPGGEVAGETEDGERVVGLIGTGGYAEYAAVPKATTFPIPSGVSDGQALALLVQGLTAWHLYRTSAHLREGETAVVHAAAGGVGSLAVQLGKAFGARVIATASTEEKRQLALELGADAAVDVTREDLTDALIEANDGRRVDIVLEMAGGRVFDASLRALAPFGRLVTYGMRLARAEQGRRPPT